MNKYVDELRAAANHVRELADNAPPGPWTASEHFHKRSGALVDVVVQTQPPEGSNVAWTDKFSPQKRGMAHWIACLGPQIAEPLAEMFEWEAQWMEDNDDGLSPSGLNNLAKVILNAK